HRKSPNSILTFSRSCDRRHLPSFPTRRSSDLAPLVLDPLDLRALVRRGRLPLVVRERPDVPLRRREGDPLEGLQAERLLGGEAEIGRAHVLSPVTWPSRMASSTCKTKNDPV